MTALSIRNHRLMRTRPIDTTVGTVVGYLDRRRRSALVLTAGEAATLAIGVLRGCGAAPSRAARAQWHLTAEGRPVLVDDPDGDDLLSATVAVLDQLARLVHADVQPGFIRLRDGVLTAPPRTWDALEARLLAVVEPQPVVLGPLTPVRTDAPQAPGQRPTDADATTLLDGVRAAMGQRRMQRIAVVCGTVATAVAVVGFTVTTPQSDSASSTSATSPAPTAVQSSPPASDATPSLSPSPAPGAESPAPPSPSSEPDVRVAASTVLQSLADCTDEACASSFREHPSNAIEPAPLDPRESELDVIDDFGGLAVVRLTRSDRRQYVTLIREKDRWLVRSVEDVADQPS